MFPREISQEIVSQKKEAKTKKETNFFKQLIIICFNANSAYIFINTQQKKSWGLSLAEIDTWVPSFNDNLIS